MANNEAGAFLNITPDVLKKLDSFDDKLEQIEKHAHTAADALKNGFGKVVIDTTKLENAITSLASKMNALNSAGNVVQNIGTSMNQVSKDATKAASSLSSVAQSINKVKPDNSLAKSVEQYRSISSQIEQVSSRQKQLNDIIKSYELTMSRIQSGKGGVIQAGQQQQVQAARQEFEENNKLLSTLKQKQQEIVNTNVAYQKQIQLVEQLKTYNQEQSNLPNQRSQQTLADMRAYYSELEKSSARAAKAAEKAAAKEEKERERVTAKAIKDAERKAAADEKAAQRAAKAAAESAKAQNYQKNTTVQGALDFSKTANTLQHQITAIEYLKKARLSLNTTDANYKNTLNQINQAIAKHNQALTEAGVKSQQLVTRHSNLMDTAGQLSRQLALVFSVSQIEGYVKKIVEVRGQFELQQVALRAIIQDKDKADKIFSQTLNQALKSPFQASQLITFTKQLAAYRIESDKLFDTTKRLADVSAGLGVSMDRLILAYGQVKAAAYLRGSEVRQFTEAGINLYGELQSYFQEVKGEALSTAQIVDMISKRMVKFEDVEAVFQRLTDKGGLFYNMQEVQVNTLHGQIERLKDVFAIMQNEIGKSNQEGFMSISQGIALINKLAENWRTVAAIIKSVVAGYAAYKASALAMWTIENVNMAKSISMHRTSISFKLKDIMLARSAASANAANGTAIAGAAVAQRGFNVAVASNPYGAVLAVVLALGTAIYEVVQNTNRLEKALDDIASEGAFSATQSANNYARLASTVADSTKSYQEHNKALEELKRKYSDILPEQYLNAEGIKALNGNYEKAIKTIHQYINAKTKERMIDEVGQESNKKMYSSQQKVSKEISKIIEEQHGMKVSWSDINSEIGKVQDKLMSGAIKSVQQLREETEKVVEEYTGLGNIDLSGYFTRLSGSSFGGADRFRFEKIQIENDKLREWFENTKSYLTQIESIENRFNRNSLSMTAQRYQAQKDETDKMIANAMSAYDVLRDSQKENTKVTKEELENARALVQKVLKAIGSDVEVNSEYIRKLFNDSFFFEDEKRNATQTKLRQLFDKLSDDAKKSGDESGNLWLQEFQKQINSLDLTPLQNTIKKFLLGIGGNEDIQANWVIRSGETEEEFKKRIKTEIDTRNEIVRKASSTIYPEYGQDVSKVKSELEELNKLYNELGGDKKKGVGSKAERDIWSERISVLKEMQSRYEKLNQLMGENAAIEQTLSAFKPALDFTQMGEVIKPEDIIPTKQGMIDALEKLLKQIPNDVKNAAKKTGLEKEIAELKIGIQQDYLKEQLEKTKKNIEDMFNGLDLHKKLKDAGLSESEVQQLFPGLAKTLDDVEKGIRNEYEAKRDKNGELSKTDQKDYDEALKKLNQQRVKESQDLIVELTKNYKTQLSDQLQLDRWYYEERAKIQRANLTDDQKVQYNKNLTKQYNEKSDENAWKQFQESDFYIDLFQNLDNVSTKTLIAMREKLADMKEQLKDLQPSQVRALANNMEKLNEVLAGRNPFKELIPNLKSYIGSLKDRKKHEDDYITALDEQEKVEKRLYGYTKINEDGSKERVIGESEVLAQLEAEHNAIEENTNATEEQKNAVKKKLDDAKDVVRKTEEELAKNKEITDEKKAQVDADRKKLDAANKSLNEIAKYGAEAVDAVSEFTGMLEGFGVEIPEWLTGTTEGLGQIFDGLGSIDLTRPFSIVTGAFKTISGIGKTIGSLFGIGNKDKKKEREIQRQIANVEKLQKAYEVLKEKMDEAWNSVTLHDTTKQTVANIDQQISSYQQMIKAEQDKKKTDQARIDEWNEAIKELEKTKQEILKQEQMDLGGIGGNSEYKSAAENFVQAWMDAFNETGKGIEGLEDSFDSMIENLIVKQATMRLAQGRLKKLFEEIDKSVTDDSAGGINLTKEELANINAIADTALSGLNDDLLALMETLGYKGKGKKAELSALTQSVQSVTEQTAEELAALLNSVRFFVSQQTTDISAIRALLDARYSLESEYSDSNPMLVELRAQTGYLEILSDRIDRVFAPSANSKGAGLRVFMQ